MVEFFRNYVPPKGRDIALAIAKEYTTKEGTQARTGEEELFKAWIRTINANYDTFVKRALQPEVYQSMMVFAIQKLNSHFGAGVISIIDNHGDINIPTSPKVGFNFWQ